MARNRFIFDGLAELRAALRNLPADLAGEAQKIVEGAANGAAVAVRRNYASHRRTGKLQDSVQVDHSTAGPFAAGALVLSVSPHAHLIEWGTEARHTAIGANRGRMPPMHLFVPVMEKARHDMYAQLAAMLKRHGLEVSGDGG